MRSNQRQYRRSAAVAAALAGLTLGTVMTAHAPDARADEVSPSGKGIVGGALLGGEVVTIVEAIAGVRSTAAYLVGGGLGAVGGGVGGYFIEQGSSDGRVPVYMLAGGLALIIPAVVLTLNATRYMPDEQATEDKAPTNTGPEANPGASGGTSVQLGPNSSGAGATTGGSVNTTTSPTPPAPTTPPPTTPAPAPGTTTTPPATNPPPQAPQPPLSLLHAGPGGVALGVPVPTVRPMWTPQEQARLAVQQGTEVRVPVLHVTF
jgi:hypothetical protein